MNKLFQKIHFLPEKSIGLQINLNDLGQSFSLVVIEKKGANIEISDKVIETDYEKIVKRLTKSVPINLVFTGKGLITRDLSADLVSNNTEDEIFKKTIPNANPDDFYFKIYPFFENSFKIVLTRKEIIDNWIKRINEESNFIINVDLGIFVFQNVINLIDSSVSKIDLGDLEIDIKRKSVEKINLNQNTELIKDLGIQNESLIAFSAGFNTYINTSTNKSSLHIGFSENRISYNFYKKIKLTLILSSIILFTILLVNFFIFSSLNDKANALEITLNLNGSASEKIELLQKKINERESLMMKLGLDNQSDYAFMADKIASTISRDIILTDFWIFPLKKKIEDGYPIDINSNEIEIKGKCNKSLELNDWTKKLKQLNWIEEVNIKSYKQLQNGNYKSEFELILKLNTN